MMKSMRKGMTELTATLLMLAVLVMAGASWKFTQRYVEITPASAVKGLIFTRTIDLNKYEKIGEGTGIFGAYELYTRSIKMGNQQTISVYK